MDTVVVKRKPGRPAKPQTPVSEPAVSSAVAENVGEVLFTIPRLPGSGDEAVDLDSAWTLQHDIRLRIQAELGCGFAMKSGVIGADDGRTMRVAVYPDRVEVVA